MNPVMILICLSRFNRRPALTIDEAKLDAVLVWGAAMRSVMMAGALEEALAATVGYALERKQFGKAIAKFQAIQQQLAVFATQVAASTRAAETLMVNLRLPVSMWPSPSPHW